ncbi:unnamed protein product [Echinostoma caproni]|uniref:Lipase_3 domain-containing protein n=1 Tax=Echinostoma caproni TaxID=27848 RepID=A0A183AVX7_9TREM|nr:unnamed protein product [Echinostoma caproni]
MAKFSALAEENRCADWRSEVKVDHGNESADSDLCSVHSVFVLHSNLDGVFGKSSLIERLTRARLQADAEFRVDHQNERPFPSHSYPIVPSQVSVEFTVFAISLGLLTVRYAMPFYFTSRVFSSLLSMFIALTSAFLLIDSATVAVVYKLFSIGVREPGGAVLIEFGEQEKVLSPWQCLCMSVAGLPAILINLMAVYAYGEEQFSRAVINYAQLLIAGELPPSRSARVGDPNKLRCNGASLVMECGANECVENNGSFATADRGTLDEMDMDGVREAVYGWPLTIAVTTKYWRPPPPSTMRRSGRISKRANTPILGQYPSNDSEASSTLKRLPGQNGTNGSADMNASVHTLTDLSDASKAGASRRSHLGLLVVAAIAFVWFLVTRMCLAAPFLRCFWKTELRLILINIIVTVLYLVVWLLLWFGLGVKNAWRFRLLHTTWPFWSRPNSTAGPTMENGHVTYGPDGQTPMTLHPLQAGYPALWPYMPYAPWIASTGPGGMSAGLPVGDTGDLHPLPVPLSNGNVGMQEAGSGGDSLYGCFAELASTGPPASNPGLDQYQAHVQTSGLRAGPPTVSDDSEALPEPGDHLDGNSRYFKPVQSVSFHSGLTAVNNYRTSNHQSCTPSPFQHMPCESSSRGTSPVDGAIPTSMSASVRQRGQQMAAAQNILLRQGRITDGVEPTYATLTTLSRPNGRAPSVTPESRGQTPVNGMMQQHQSSYRRNGSRVTFKDHTPDQNTLRSIHHQQQQQQQQQQDAATGSSDSGVYTNGHGMNGNGDRPVQRGRLKPELFAIYGDVRTPATGRLRPQSPPTHKSIQSSAFGRNNGQGADEVAEMSTDMTSYGARTENVMTRSSDQLCSQV